MSTLQVGQKFTIYGGCYVVARVNKGSVRAQDTDRSDRVVMFSFSNAALRDATVID